MLRAENVGKAERETFVSERLIQESDVKKAFFDPIKKVKLLTMERCNKAAKLTSSQGQLVKYREQGDVAFQLLVKS